MAANRSDVRLLAYEGADALRVIERSAAFGAFGEEERAALAKLLDVCKALDCAASDGGEREWKESAR